MVFGVQKSPWRPKEAVARGKREGIKSHQQFDKESRKSRLEEIATYGYQTFVNTLLLR